MNHPTANDQTREQVNRNNRTDRHVLCLLADGDAETEAIHDRFAHTFDQHRGIGYGASCHALRRLRAKGFERSYRTNNYLAVISGSFVDEAREALRGLVIRTPIREVRLLEATAVIELLENSLRDPEFRLGPGGYQGVGLQDFFVERGVLTEADVREELGL